MISKREIFIITKSFCKKYSINEGYADKKIVIYSDRYNHFEKHKDEYSSIDSYNESIEKIDEIIKSPDFISFNGDNKSLEFVKCLTDATLVAITISDKGELKVKTMFPINTSKKIKLQKKSFRNNN